MDLALAGKRVLITGGSKGIGLACAVAYAKEGARPILVARSQGTLDAAAASVYDKTGIQPEVCALDLAEKQGVDQVVEKFDDIDVLVNNAGAIPGGGLEQIDDARWRDAWDLKVFSYISLTRAYLQKMKQRKSGVIVNIIGMAGVNPKANYIAGASANAALRALTLGVGGESTRHGVRVFGVNPGPTETDRTLTLARQRAAASLGDADRWAETLQNLPMGRLMYPEEVANLVVFGSSDLAGYLSGTVIDLDGGHRYAPVP